LNITTDGGTEFTVTDKNVTIANGGHVIVVPLADLQEFFELYLDAGEDDE
jgi:hypothetical protein